MTAVHDAEAHVAKAREFLEAAHAAHDRDLNNAAASNAVTSGINAKDAICLRRNGRTEKSDAHQQAVNELKNAGPAGAALATTLSRLLKLKTKSQYQSASISAADAAKAIEWAERMVETAQQVVSGR